MINFLCFSTTTERSWNVRFRGRRLKTKSICRTWTTKQEKPLSLKYHIIILFMCHISELFHYYLYCMLCHKPDNRYPRSFCALRWKSPNIPFFCRFCFFEVHLQNRLVGQFCATVRAFAKCPKMAVFDTLNFLSNIRFFFSNCLLHRTNLNRCRVDINGGGEQGGP